MAASTALAFELGDALRVLRRNYGLEAEVSELPSYADRNFRVRCAAGAYVLKIARHDEPDRELDFQNSALGHLSVAGIPGPELVEAVEGTKVVHVADADGQTVRARLVTWMEGIPLASVADRSPALLGHFGTFLARLDGALAGFEHPAATRSLWWDLRRALAARAHLPLLDGDPMRQALVRSQLDAFARGVDPIFGELPQQVVHNDANDHNVLVQGQRVTAIIDYGDMVRTARVCDPAIALCYLMLGVEDPYAQARLFLAGYQAQVALEERELEALAHLIPTRLAVSVLTSIHAKRERPDDPYLDVTEPHAWALLERLAEVRSDELLHRILPR